MNKSKKGSHVVKLAILGASLAGIAASAYFFFGPESAKRRKHAKAWAIKMKGEIVEKLEGAKEITESAYHTIVDAVASEYEKSRKASREEIAELAEDLKEQWASMSEVAKDAKEDVTEDVSKVEKIVKK